MIVVVVDVIAHTGESAFVAGVGPVVGHGVGGCNLAVESVEVAGEEDWVVGVAVVDGGAGGAVEDLPLAVALPAAAAAAAGHIATARDRSGRSGFFGGEAGQHRHRQCCRCCRWCRGSHCTTSF